MEKNKIYLDNCCFNRPYDDQDLLSIYLEAQAKLAIQGYIKDKEIDLVWSFILDFENGAHPDEIIKQEIFYWRKLSSVIVYKNELIVTKAITIAENGIGKKDALHIASAIEAKADFFITVDKEIIKKRKFINEIEIINPIEYITILEDTCEKR